MASAATSETPSINERKNLCVVALFLAAVRLLGLTLTAAALAAAVALLAAVAIALAVDLLDSLAVCALLAEGCNYGS